MHGCARRRHDGQDRLTQAAPTLLARAVIRDKHTCLVLDLHALIQRRAMCGG